MNLTTDFDAIIVGCGLAGSVIARFLAEERNRKVLVIDRRSHIGGNMYDQRDKHGILIHQYGPHTFHTNDKELYDYMCRYAEWNEYKLTCMAEIDGISTPTPFNFQTIDDFFVPQEAKELKEHITAKFGERKTATVVELLESDDSKIREYAQFLFDKDYSLYTAKQWGVSPKEIDPSVLKRVPLRFSYDTGYFDDKYQIMPKTTYVEFFENLLDHPNIKVKLETDALAYLSVATSGTHLLLDNKPVDFPVIYTGPLDELFDFAQGHLPYRSLEFEWKYEEIDSFQDAPVVAYPQAEGFTRITEYKKLPVQSVCGTTYAIEYPLPYRPGQNSEPYYPLLTQESKSRYDTYKTMAKAVVNLYFCGRLADFKYYNMDQVLKRALEVCDEL